MKKERNLTSAQALCKSLREDAGFSRKELSTLLEIPESTIVNIERGRMHLTDAAKDRYSYYFKMDPRLFEEKLTHKVYDSVHTIRDILDERGISVTEFAALFGFTSGNYRYTALNVKDSRTRKKFTKDEIREVCKALHVSPDVFKDDVIEVRNDKPGKNAKEWRLVRDKEEDVVNTKVVDDKDNLIETLKKENASLAAQVRDLHKQLEAQQDTIDYLTADHDCFLEDEAQYKERISDLTKLEEEASKKAEYYQDLYGEYRSLYENLCDEKDKHKDILLALLIKEYNETH